MTDEKSCNCMIEDGKTYRVDSCPVHGDTSEGVHIEGTASWRCYTKRGLWYIALDGRAVPPYLNQVRVEAILDLDSDGRLAGIEIIDLVRGAPLLPPKTKGNAS